VCKAPSDPACPANFTATGDSIGFCGTCGTCGGTEAMPTLPTPSCSFGDEVRYFARSAFVSVSPGPLLDDAVAFSGVGQAGQDVCALNCSATPACLSFDHNLFSGTCARYSFFPEAFCEGGAFRCREEGLDVTTFTVP